MIYKTSAPHVYFIQSNTFVFPQGFSHQDKVNKPYVNANICKETQAAVRVGLKLFPIVYFLHYMQLMLQKICIKN